MDQYIKKFTSRKRDDAKSSGHPIEYVCRCVWLRVAGVQVECRDGVPARRRRVESSRAVPRGANYPRLGAASLPRRRWAAKQTRDPRSASCAPFLTSFRPGLSRSVTRKCPPAGSTIVVVCNQSGGCLNMYNDVLIYPSLEHIFDIEHRKHRWLFDSLSANGIFGISLYWQCSR